MMESLLCSPRPDFGSFDAPDKDLLKDIKPSESSTEEFPIEGGDQRQEDSTLSAEEVPKQPDSFQPTDSSFNDYDYNFMPINDYYPFDEVLDYEPEEPESLPDESGPKETGGDYSSNTAQSKPLPKNPDESSNIRAASPQLSCDNTISTNAVQEEQATYSKEMTEQDLIKLLGIESRLGMEPVGSSDKNEEPLVSNEEFPPVEEESPPFKRESFPVSEGSLSVKEEPTPVKEESLRAEEEPLPEEGTLPAEEQSVIKEIASAKRSVEVVSEDDGATSEEVAQAEAPRTGPLSSEELAKIWELATKLCEARSAYNAQACRRKPAAPRQSRKKPPARLQVRARPVQPDPMTNNGVCRIGKGNDWNDPPEWDWGQPLPEEISKVVAEVLPSRPPANAPTISAFHAIASSSNCFTAPPLMKSGEPITLDSDDELPDFSLALGLPKKAEPFPETYDVADTSCSVIAVRPSNLAPSARRGRKRVFARGTRKNANVNSNEVITLDSSDSSDGEIEVVSAPKKPAPLPKELPKELPSEAKEPEKPKEAPPVDNSRNEWSCPICFETKDRVPNLMSTTCGHIFCGPCLQSTVKINKQCPTCRKKLTVKQIHNLYM